MLGQLTADASSTVSEENLRRSYCHYGVDRLADTQYVASSQHRCAPLVVSDQ